MECQCACRACLERLSGMGFVRFARGVFVRH